MAKLLGINSSADKLQFSDLLIEKLSTNERDIGEWERVQFLNGKIAYMSRSGEVGQYPAHFPATKEQRDGMY